MAQLKIKVKKIQENILALSDFFKEHEIHWSLVTKVFSGDLEFLKHVLTPEIVAKIDSVGDSRLTSLKNLKTLNPDMQTIYIKPPAKIYAEEVVKYADISLNSSFSTILALNEAARQNGKQHKVIIMIELGELREGVKRTDIMKFYEKVFQLEHIEVIGLGSNLGCMYGVEPTYDKLLQLSLYKELISAKFNKTLPLVSGGTSITLPLIDRGIVPKEVNHFRVGEAAFFGLSPLENKPFMGLNTDTFQFEANIIELDEKKIIPDGVISDASVGMATDFQDAEPDDKSHKAILDFGLLDVDKGDIDSTIPNLDFVGITSDMMVVDLGSNKDSNGKPLFKPGDKIKFSTNYMAVARLLNSKFIDKIFV